MDNNSLELLKTNIYVPFVCKMSEIYSFAVLWSVRYLNLSIFLMYSASNVILELTAFFG